MFNLLTRLLRLRKVFDELSRLIKIELICSYVNFVDAIRRIFISGIVVIICLVLFFTGFLLIHLSLFLILPWSIQDRAIFFVILSSIYMLVPALIVYVVHSRPQWLKRFGVAELIARVPPR